MLQNQYEIRVLVKGRPITEYPHNGQTFVEGRDGSNFEIEFKNNTPTRVEAVLSVDGLSVIDGKEAGPQSSGYVVDGNSTVRIPGWKLTDEQVAAFVFAGKKGSYATQMTGSARNNGVIGALVFKEKPVVPVYHQYHHIQAQPYFGAPRGGFVKGMGSSGGYVHQGSSDLNSDPFYGIFVGAQLSASDAPFYNGTQTMNHIAPSGAVASASVGEQKTRGGVIGQAKLQAQVEVEQTLGTGCGAATDFETSLVKFERGDLAVMMVLYYDDSRGLKARGIQLTRPSKAKLSQQPQAFPGMNCAPPPGWKG